MTSRINGVDSAVYGKLRYIPAGHIPISSPHNFHLPAISEFGDERLLPLQNMRPLPTVDQLPNAPTDAAQLETHGFTAVHHPSRMHSSPYSPSSWKDPNLLREIYVPETEDLVKRLTGARTVITEALLIRSAIWSESDALATHGSREQSGPKVDIDTNDKEKFSELETGFPQCIGFNPAASGVSPAPKIHLDYAPTGARTHIRKFHPDLRRKAARIISAEDKLTEQGKDIKQYYAKSPSECPRWALFSIWRPLKRVTRDPLALGDQRTFRPEDYITVQIKEPELGVNGNPEPHFVDSYVAKYSEGHKWFWVQDQMPEEVLVIGLFDSDRESERVAAGGTLHSSVDLEGTEAEAPRESLELRCLAIW